MRQADLDREVSEVIDELLFDGSPASVAWVVQGVMGRHKDITGQDENFARLCAYEHVRRTVLTELRNRKRADDESGQVEQGELFPGYVRVQKSYVISRDGEQMVVRLDLMTEAEVRAKVGELRRMAEGALDHARELEDYLAARFKAVA